MRPLRAATALAALGLLAVGIASAPAADAVPKSSYKSYLFTLDDNFSCASLASHVNEEAGASLMSVTAHGQAACQRVLGLRVSGLGLTDLHNPVVVALGKGARISLRKPSTLFAPFALTYDPDSWRTEQLGWPIRNAALQDSAFQKVQQGLPSCTLYISGGIVRLSPYTSHCSAYAAWVAERVFGINLYPTALGDWCHAASEQRDRMLNDPANWRKVTAVQAQEFANRGALVMAARKKEDATKPAHNQNGHIAVVLPMVAAVAATLQDGVTYPATPAITDEASFAEFVRLYGPEISQAGGLNFRHTVTANGFSSYYPPGTVPGVTPVDEVVDFFVYRHETKVDWLPL